MYRRRIICAVVLAVFAIASCSSKWKQVMPSDDPTYGNWQAELLGNEARFRMSNGEERYLKVVTISGPYARGYSPDAPSASDTSTVDLREVTTAEVLYSNDGKVVMGFALVGVALLVLVLSDPIEFK